MDAHSEVVRLLDQIRALTHNPVIERASDQIEVLCRSYMEMEHYSGLPADLAGIHFTKAEIAVLNLLIRRRGNSCSRDSIMAVMPHPWAGEEACISQVSVRLVHIRRKLKGTRYEGSIETISGTGYRMKTEAEMARSEAA